MKLIDFVCQIVVGKRYWIDSCGGEGEQSFNYIGPAVVVAVNVDCGNSYVYFKFPVRVWNNGCEVFSSFRNKHIMGVGFRNSKLKIYEIN